MNFKFQPAFMEVEFNFSAMASVVSPSKNSLEVTGHFRSYSDFVVMSFNSKDYRMHQGARFFESKDYSGVNLSFSPSFIGNVARFDDQRLRPALIIKYTDGTQKYVTLGFLSDKGDATDRISSFTQRLNLSRQWISWDSEEVKWEKRVVVGYENVFDSDGKFVKVREVKELQSGIGSREKDYVIDYVSGEIWPVEGSSIPYGAKLTVTYKYGLHQTYNINFSDLKQGTHPNNTVSVPSNNIERVSLPVMPSYFESGKDQLTGKSDEVVVKFDNWSVSGGELGDFPKAKGEHLFRLAEGYDDEYYRNPLRLVQAMHHLGYRKVINLYIGASHYYEKKGIAGAPSWDHNAQVLIKERGICSATKKWIKYLCKAMKVYGFTELIVSVSMENLQMPQEWRQKTYDGIDGQTGWKPATCFFSPTNNEVRVYFEKICRDALDILVEENMPVILQLGEPWWWWQEFKPGNIHDPYPGRPPCFYDESTKQKYKAEKGVDLPIYKTSDIALTEANKAVILWLREQLGDFSNFIKGIAKSYAGGKYAVLFFPPSVLDDVRVPEAIRLANVPKDQWQFPNLDFIQIEDYDWLIHQKEGHSKIFDFAQEYFKYPPSKTHYFSGFAWNQYGISIVKQWDLIEKAAATALSKGFEDVFIWAGTQIRRDSWNAKNQTIPVVGQPTITKKEFTNRPNDVVVDIWFTKGQNNTSIIVKNGKTGQIVSRPPVDGGYVQLIVGSHNTAYEYHFVGVNGSDESSPTVLTFTTPEKPVAQPAISNIRTDVDGLKVYVRFDKGSNVKTVVVADEQESKSESTSGNMRVIAFNRFETNYKIKIKTIFNDDSVSDWTDLISVKTGKKPLINSGGVQLLAYDDTAWKPGQVVSRIGKEILQTSINHANIPDDGKCYNRKIVNCGNNKCQLDRYSWIDIYERDLKILSTKIGSFVDKYIFRIFDEPADSIQMVGGILQAKAASAAMIATGWTGLGVVWGYVALDGASNAADGLNKIKDKLVGDDGQDWNFVRKAYKSMHSEYGEDFYNLTQVGIGMVSVGGALKKIPQNAYKIFNKASIPKGAKIATSYISTPEQFVQTIRNADTGKVYQHIVVYKKYIKAEGIVFGVDAFNLKGAMDSASQ